MLRGLCGRTRRSLARPEVLQGEICPALQRLLSRRTRRDVGDIIGVWKRYLANHNKADFDRLCHHYMPQVWVAAGQFVRRKPWVTMGEAVSDGMIGLVDALTSATDFEPGSARQRCDFRIRRAIFREFRCRLWGGRSTNEKFVVIHPLQRQLKQSLGREPSRDEMIEALKARVKNVAPYVPAIGLEEKRIGHFRDESKRDLRNIRDRSAGQAIEGLIYKEGMAASMKRLKGIDRKIFKLLIEGKSVAEIHTRLRVCNAVVYSRLNGIEAAVREGLSAYLNVAKEALPNRMIGGRKFRSPRRCQASEPARLAG